MEIYQVKKGDTLSAIALNTLGDANRWPDIARLNNLADTVIFPGQQLMLPDDALAPVVINAKRRADPGAPVADPGGPSPLDALLSMEPMTKTALALLAFFVLISLGNDDG